MKTRREILRLAGLTLAAHSFVSGEEAAPGSFEFIVVNDTHYLDEKCAPWFTRVVAAMRASAPEAVFCLHAGDITDRGTPEAVAAMARILGELGTPLHPVPGNHDFLTNTDRSGYDAAFPGKLNYRFEHGGWQFLALDSTQGTDYQDTSISAATLAWLEGELPKLDPHKPVFAVTHFPLGDGVKYRPANTDALLALLAKTNLRWVHSGHWHGESVKPAGDATFTTSRCCSRIRDNHDGSLLKGWHVYRAAPTGTLARRFVEAPPA
jgi:3',5'-cyclic AMP phosphodiesterase CpdA